MLYSVVSKRIFEMLIHHLVAIEEEKEVVIEKYYPDWTDERNDFQELMDNYIQRIEDIVHNKLKAGDHGVDECPLAIIGSRLTLKDAYTNKLEKLQIVSPFTGNTRLDLDCASYLSPMGRAFLLRGLGDDVEVETPMGIFQYKIEAIEIPADMFQFY